MAITCAHCGKHIAPFNDGGERWYCTECRERGYAPPLPPDDGEDDADGTV